jgi:hypothetical protein
VLVDSGWDVVAGGVDIWETKDQFHFVFKVMTGDFDVAVRHAEHESRAAFRDYTEFNPKF